MKPANVSTRSWTAVTRRYSFLCWSILFLPAHLSGRQEKSVPIQLIGGEARLEIVDERGDSSWSSYYAREVPAYLKACESYTAIPFHATAAPFYESLPADRRWEVRLIGREKVFLNGVWVGGYNNSSGIYGDDRGIFVEYGRTAVREPALVLHELGHFWFYSIPWLSEGIVSFLPLVLNAEGLLSLSPAELKSIWVSWGFRQVPAGGDQPTEVDFRASGGDSFLLWYNKTFKVQYIICRELGMQKYMDFLRLVAERGPRLESSADVLDILQSLRSADWRRLLSGWVFDGPYRDYPWEFFRDESLSGTFVGPPPQ